MPKLSPFARNLILVFIFFAIGRILVLKLGNNGVWLTIGGVIVFYALWWVYYQRKKKKL